MTLTALAGRVETMLYLSVTSPGTLRTEKGLPFFLGGGKLEMSQIVVAGGLFEGPARGLDSHLVNPVVISRDTLDSKALGAVYEKMKDGRVDQGMADLLPVLQARRLRSTEADWNVFVDECLRHPLRELLHQDPFTYRAFSKPRGYAGDAELLDFVYGREEGWPAPEGTSELGRKIFEFTTASSACEAVRARRGFIADTLDKLVEEVSRPDILSLACGHLREAHLCAAVKRRKFGRFVALDADEESLEEVTRCYGRHGVEVVPGRIRQLLTQRLNLGTFDYVYSTGLFDYLAMPAAQRLAQTMFEMLRPRGRLLVANFLHGILDVGYMETYMGWKLMYRTRQDMLEISRDIPQAQIRDIHIFAEENQNIIFLEVTKR
jgi:extracellular factor (EF) 3-hydroxypalmitic acid methyl ester biosynthesis protein